MKCLVVYQSENGNNSKLAEAFYHTLRERNVDVRIRKIISKNKYPSFVQGFQSLFERKVKLSEVFDAKAYDLVILCTPVKGMRMTPEVRSLIDTFQNLNGKKALVTSCCVSDGEKALMQISRDLHAKGASVIDSAGIVVEDAHLPRKLNNFVTSCVDKCLLHKSISRCQS